jgi:hypothetical protein
VPRPTDFDRDVDRLEGELKRLEAEYNMFFAGRAPKPPLETRSRVAAMVRRLDGLRLQNTAQRFRFDTLQSRFTALVDLWDRGQRAREEGRPGPFLRPASAAERPHSPDVTRVLYVAAMHDPSREREKLEDLYESVAAARREAGAPPVPFDRFAALVRRQVDKVHAAGSPEVAFRVALKDGKVTLTARSLKAPSGLSRPGGEE